MGLTLVGPALERATPVLGPAAGGLAATAGLHLRLVGEAYAVVGAVGWVRARRTPLGYPAAAATAVAAAGLLWAAFLVRVGARTATTAVLGLGVISAAAPVAWGFPAGAAADRRERGAAVALAAVAALPWLWLVVAGVGDGGGGLAGAGPGLAVLPLDAALAYPLYRLGRRLAADPAFHNL